MCQQLVNLHHKHHQCHNLKLVAHSPRTCNAPCRPGKLVIGSLKSSTPQLLLRSNLSSRSTLQTGRYPPRSSSRSPAPLTLARPGGLRAIRGSTPIAGPVWNGCGLIDTELCIQKEGRQYQNIQCNAHLLSLHCDGL